MSSPLIASRCSGCGRSGNNTLPHQDGPIGPRRRGRWPLAFPPDRHEPRLWPAFGELQVLQVGADLEPGGLDGLDGPALGSPTEAVRRTASRSCCGRGQAWSFSPRHAFDPPRQFSERRGGVVLDTGTSGNACWLGLAPQAVVDPKDRRPLIPSSTSRRPCSTPCTRPFPAASLRAWGRRATEPAPEPPAQLKWPLSRCGERRSGDQS
jgi:hypothetical protein